MRASTSKWKYEKLAVVVRFPHTIKNLVITHEVTRIHRKKKDGDWFIYLKCFAYGNSEKAYKNKKKNCKSFKLDKSNAVTVGMTAIKPYLSIYLVGLVWFARYCGKMYSRHLFSNGGLLITV